MLQTPAVTEYGGVNYGQGDMNFNIKSVYYVIIFMSYIILSY